jgi:hypothetical protein
MRVSYPSTLDSEKAAKDSLVIDYTKINPAKTIPQNSIDVMIDSIGATFSSVLGLPNNFIVLH